MEARALRTWEIFHARQTPRQPARRILLYCAPKMHMDMGGNSVNLHVHIVGRVSPKFAVLGALAFCLNGVLLTR